MTDKYGRYMSKHAYAHAKAERRRNSRRWRKNNPAQEKAEWRKCGAKHFILHYATKQDIFELSVLLDQRERHLSD